MASRPVPPDRPGEDDPKTREAAERHRTRPDPPIQGQTTGRQLEDTDGEGGVGGSLDGLYVKEPGAHDPPGSDPESPRQDPAEIADLQYTREHGELGDGNDDFTGERAEEARKTELGEGEPTQSLTSTGVMEDNLDVGAEEGSGAFVEGTIERPAPRRRPAANRRDPRKPPDPAIER